jgi:Ca2+:H+ antiporter
MGGLSRLELAVLALVAGLSALTGWMHYAGTSDVATFIVGAIALAGLAWIVSFSTEAVGARTGPALTGVLQSTLGNLPELFIVLFSIRAGELVVAQTTILGSIFANALLVLGLVIIAGSRAADDGVMRFRRRLPNDATTLLLLAVFIIAICSLSDTIGDRASGHTLAISCIGAVLLLSVYGVWLWGYLRGQTAEPGLEAPGSHRLPIVLAIVLLALAGVGAALVSDWFVEALRPAIDTLGISAAFTGLVIVAIAGNAVENVVGIVLAARGQADLAISVVKNSVAQVAVFLYPALVLLSLFFADRLTFASPPILLAALVLAAISVWQVTGDGEAVMFEGWALVAIYVILATVAWYE